MRLLLRQFGVATTGVSTLAGGAQLRAPRGALSRSIWLGLATAAAVPAVAIVFLAQKADA